MLIVFLFSGCGGGSQIPAPTVNLYISESKVSVGTSVTLTWSSLNASSCTGLESMTGGAQATSGSKAITPTVGGQFSYTLSCDGVGGNTKSSVLLIVPMPVLKSSYENKIAAGKVLGPVKTNGDATAFADFLQDGSYSMVRMSLIYDVNKPISSAIPGQIYFYQNKNGVWNDITSKLITNTTACIHPRKAMVADINGDRKPDVVFACHGYDSPPFPGEQQHILLSQPDGTYKNVTLPTTAYAHGGSVADVKGNGFADIVYTDTIVRKQPFYLVNNNDGTFTEDSTRIPQSLKKVNCCERPIYSMEFIDFNNDDKYDLWVGASIHNADANGYVNNINSEIYYGIFGGNFSTTVSKILPSSLVAGATLDIIFEKGKIYLLNTLDYTGISIDKYDINNNAFSTPYTHTGNYPNAGSWFPWIIIYNDNISASNSDYQVSIPK